ncbi:hypothetical protein O3P69_007916 [Scylla paramamosain]|uniref:Uncharacterized protein n=1 Tax=Scylla paramamosain TaxID=85552 RepID=A0AAW0T0B7_SCYPA
MMRRESKSCFTSTVSVHERTSAWRVGTPHEPNGRLALPPPRPAALRPVLPADGLAKQSIARSPATISGIRRFLVQFLCPNNRAEDTARETTDDKREKPVMGDVLAEPLRGDYGRKCKKEGNSSRPKERLVQQGRGGEAGPMRYQGCGNQSFKLQGDRREASVAGEAPLALMPSHKRFNITTTSLAGTRDEQDIFCFRRILGGLSVAVRCVGPRGSCTSNDLKVSFIVLTCPVDSNTHQPSPVCAAPLPIPRPVQLRGSSKGRACDPSKSVTWKIRLEDQVARQPHHHLAGVLTDGFRQRRQVARGTDARRDILRCFYYNLRTREAVVRTVVFVDVVVGVHQCLLYAS